VSRLVGQIGGVVKLLSRLTCHRPLSGLVWPKSREGGVETGRYQKMQAPALFTQVQTPLKKISQKASKLGEEK